MDLTRARRASKLAASPRLVALPLSMSARRCCRSYICLCNLAFSVVSLTLASFLPLSCLFNSRICRLVSFASPRPRSRVVIRRDADQSETKCVHVCEHT